MDRNQDIYKAAFCGEAMTALLASRGVPCIIPEDKKGDACQSCHTISGKCRHALSHGYAPTSLPGRNYID